MPKVATGSNVLVQVLAAGKRTRRGTEHHLFGEGATSRRTDGSERETIGSQTVLSCARPEENVA